MRIIKCQNCGKEFSPKNRTYTQKCCSYQCDRKLNPRKSYFKEGKPSWNKNKKNWRPDYRHSVETKRKIGKGNTKLPEERRSELADLIRHEKKYYQWRNNIFERDNWTCRDCAKRSKAGERIQLRAHHIVGFAEILKKYQIKTVEDAYRCRELRDLENGITLCRKCHKLTHTGKKAKKL